MNNFSYFKKWHRRIWWAIFFIPGITLLISIVSYAFMADVTIWFVPVAQCLAGISGILIGISFAPYVLWILTRIFEPELFRWINERTEDS